VRTIFMGTPQFAVPSLQALAANTNVVAVFTRRDAASGRGRSVLPSPVKSTATTLGLNIHQPATLRDEETVSDLAALRPDLIVVVAFGLILPPSVLDIPSLGAINVHASLLPRWRGAAPIQRAILAGDFQTGVSIMRVEEGLDTGPYCSQRALPIGSADASRITERLARLGADLLVESLYSIRDGSAIWVDQDNSAVTYADKIDKDDIAIDPAMSVDKAWRHVRASSPSSPCRVTVAGRGLTIASGEVADTREHDAPVAGVVASAKGGILLGMEDGALFITRLKPDGKAEMAASDWARGARGVDGSTWDPRR